MTKDRGVDDSCATTTVKTLHMRRVCCSLPGHYSAYIPNIPSAGEAVRYKAKALVTDNTLLEVFSADTALLAGLLLVLVNVLTKVHAAVSNQTTPY